MSKRILLIDNYDSFTYNLLHYLCELGADVTVKRNDEIAVSDVLSEFEQSTYHGLLISPGPCAPDQAGICLELLQEANGSIPTLGVCLGHQAIGQVYGGQVIQAEEPIHGKVSAIYHQNQSVFEGLPSPFDATRYHSLIVEKSSLPDCLTITAETEDGIIMGLMHKDHPVHGVQFHPESIASEHGHAILKRFLEML